MKAIMVEPKKPGAVRYDYFRNTRENDFYPHYIHNLDNLIRFGGIFPPVQVHADIRRTVLLGVTQVPHEGGASDAGNYSGVREVSV